MAFTTVDDPTIYFNTVLYTGNGSNGHGITGVGFQPDWIWIKGRSVAENHNVYDSVRGAGIRLIPNTGSNDTTKTDTQKSFDSDGFTLDSGAEVNDNSQTFVSWNWKAGTSFSNSGGSNGADLASSGTFNRTAGFSIVTFTGNATANQQIYHGLNSVPKWMVLKNRTNTNNESWCVYHEFLGNTKKLTLNTTATANTDTEFWQDTTPTSTVFTVGRQDAVNGSGNTHVVYCFSEIQGYSKFGQYIGNGNADGTFAYTGFRPAWVMVRDPNNAENWPQYDNKRPGFNVTNNHLFANDASGETASTANIMDFYSNGFKIRSNNNGLNRSGGTFLFMAFAESPFVNSNGIPNNAR
tara:strand:- start:49 stop:1104 length:1056 start_codon:yes stop_codon:yes gene_type:complete